jgi:hypothetical protein
VADLATDGGCYNGREALLPVVDAFAASEGVFSGDDFSGYNAFCCKRWGALLPVAEGAATRDVQCCYLGEDVFSDEGDFFPATASSPASTFSGDISVREGLHGYESTEDRVFRGKEEEGQRGVGRPFTSLTKY